MLTVASEALTCGLGNRIEEREVVRGGRDRYMTHGGRERGEFRLDIDSRAVPTEQPVHRIRVPKVMNTRHASARGTNASTTEETT